MCPPHIPPCMSQGLFHGCFTSIWPCIGSTLLSSYLSWSPSASCDYPGPPQNLSWPTWFTPGLLSLPPPRLSVTAPWLLLTPWLSPTVCSLLWQPIIFQLQRRKPPIGDWTSYFICYVHIRKCTIFALWYTWVPTTERDFSSLFHVTDWEFSILFHVTDSTNISQNANILYNSALHSIFVNTQHVSNPILSTLSYIFVHNSWNIC